MLQVIISPAKQMHVRADAFAPRGIPPFPAKTLRLLHALRAIEREQGPDGLKTLWRVNDKLLDENIEHLHAFEPVMDEASLDDPAIARVVCPAAFSYIGIQYRSMAPGVLDLDALEWLQQHLWILSGFYGCVRPFDAVQPYRLEMGARLQVSGARNLYGFWGSDIADAIAVPGFADESGSAVVNLASVEYAKAVLPHLPRPMQVVTCLFGEELRGGKPVQRATASKIARGSMVRWMAEHRAERIADLTRFDVGYAFAPELSTVSGAFAEGDGAQTLIFMRS